MASLQAADIPDLVTTTLRSLGRLKMTDNMSKYRRTVALKRIIRDKKMTVDDGYEFQFNVITGTNGSARGVPLAARDQVSINNVMTTGSMPFRHVTWNWAYDQREPSMNGGASKIVDLLKVRRITAHGDAIAYFENKLWRVQPLTNTIDMQGIPYWVVKNNTEGFNGTVPAGHTTVANISSTLYPRWANWTAQYATVDETDMIRKARKAAFMTDFEPFVDDVATYNMGDDYGFYTNYAVYGTMVEILESQNDNLGKDIASMEGKVLFMRVPIMAVQELEDDTTNPFYGINWGVMHACRLRGWWMRETVIPTKSDQHTITLTHTDCSLNTICHDRRRNFVIALDTTELAV